MSETGAKRADKKPPQCEFIPPMDHGVNYDPISPPELVRHIRASNIRIWLVTETCKNCPDHFRVRKAVDSKQSLVKDIMRARCLHCLDDSLEFFTQDLGPAREDEPCVSLGGKVWR